MFFHGLFSFPEVCDEAEVDVDEVVDALVLQQSIGTTLKLSLFGRWSGDRRNLRSNFEESFAYIDFEGEVRGILVAMVVVALLVGLGFAVVVVGNDKTFRIFGISLLRARHAAACRRE